MKKLNLFPASIIIFLIIMTLQLTTHKLTAQELSHSVTCSGGETFTAQDYSLEFVIGEPLSEYYQNEQTLLTQGFLQDIVGPTAIFETKIQLAALHVYPNPAIESLSFDVENEAIINWYEIISIYGNPIEKTNCGRNIGKINISRLKPGIYLLIAGIENHIPVTKKFIKK